MATLRILVADDHEIVRQGICALLQAHPGWEVCAQAADGREAVESTAQLKPDVAILDIGMPNLNGLNATRQILQENPQTKVLILTIYESEQVLREVLGVGAHAYLLKSDAGRDLITAIEALQANKPFFSSKAGDVMLENFRKSKTRPSGKVKEVLTIREREVVQLLAEGKTTKEVAVALGLSVKTAETHRSNVMRKLNLHSVSELVLYAVRNNIVQVLQPRMPSPEE